MKPVNGAFDYTFDPDSLYSLTTTTGQGKGTAQPPPPAAFPLPYADDFEKTPIGHTPKYLSDQDGAFEVHACDGRTGQCLEQVISEKPIPWGAAAGSIYTGGRCELDAITPLLPMCAFLPKRRRPSWAASIPPTSSRMESALWPSGYVLRLKPTAHGNFCPRSSRSQL